MMELSLNRLGRRRFVASTLAAAAPRPAAGRKPNIVLIAADDLGYADLNVCGDASIHSPNLDSMAAEGVRFTDFTVSWPACTPSRSSILTGRYPQRNGLYDMIRNNEVNWKFQYDEEGYAVSPEMTIGMDVREVTLGQVMKSAGYATGAVGKWDGGRARRFLPLQRGFDYYYGFANTGIDYYTHERYGVASMFRGNDRIREEGHATDLFKREALRFLEENRSRPFFLYLPFNAPHGASTFRKEDPQAPAEYMAMYKGDRRAQYKALVTHMDAAVGEILAQVKQYGLDNDTLVVFISDNGGSGQRNGPLRGGKATLWEGGVRVPLIARWPGRIPAGAVRDEFASTLELLPTFAALAGAELPRGVKMDGFDMMPLLEGKSGPGRAEMFYQQKANRSARVGKWKWIDSIYGKGLFDLSKDPGEAADLRDSNPAKASEIESRWMAWRREMDGADPRGPFRDY
ncbi:MAG: sulfatase-like hydrolase/transferase [Bryobacteraceae bacterium]